MTDLFPSYVVWFAFAVVVVMLVWVFLIHCGDLMHGAWQAMKGREWRWPEGTNGVYGPGDEPRHRKQRGGSFETIVTLKDRTMRNQRGEKKN